MEIKKAANIIRNGGLVAFPTETVYGLGADALNPEAVKKIYMAKGRPPDNPLILHVSNVEDVNNLAEEINGTAKCLMDEYWPGPLTLVFKKKETLPGWVGGHPDNKMTTVAIRSPKNVIAQKLIEESGCAIAAPSANKAGTPSPTCVAHVKKDFNEDGVFILDGGETAGGIESTVVDVTGDMPVVLRPGIITREMIFDTVLHNKFGSNEGYTAGSEDYSQPDNIAAHENAPISPGMKYRHYAPEAPLTLVCGNIDFICGYIYAAGLKTDTRLGILATSQTADAYCNAFNGKENIFVLTAGDRLAPETIAHNLYASLRKFNELKVDEILAEGVEDCGIGSAIMNRLRKAAGGKIVRQ